MLENIIILVVFGSMLGFVVGMIKPKQIIFWKNDATRKTVAMYMLAIFLGSSIIMGVVSEPQEEATSTEPLSSESSAEQSINALDGQAKDDSQTEINDEADETTTREPTSEEDSQETSGDKEEIDTNRQPSNQELANPPPKPEARPSTPAGELKVYFFDVGQADATLLKGPDFTVLIDAGDWRRNDVIPHLRSAGVTSIDLLIATHPHADHIGQMDKVIEAFPVKEVWMSGYEHTTNNFERVIDAILASDAGYHEPRRGESFNLGSLKIEIVSPTRVTSDLHESSISFRAIYGGIAFIFTGDAERQTELEMVRSGMNLKAQIFQAGHHGSSTSNTQEFLNAVKPEVFIYSAGKDNSYGHPHDEVISRVKAMGVEVFGTDVHGTVLVKTDGSSYSISTGKSGAIATNQSQETQPTTVPVAQESQNIQVITKGRVNINTATKEELIRVVHIGEARADAIIQQRPFSSLNELINISGISDDRLADIKAEGIAYVE